MMTYRGVEIFMEEIRGTPEGVDAIRLVNSGKHGPMTARFRTAPNRMIYMAKSRLGHAFANSAKDALELMQGLVDKSLR